VPYHAKSFAGKNVSEMTYICVKWDVKISQVNAVLSLITSQSQLFIYR